MQHPSSVAKFARRTFVLAAALAIGAMVFSNASAANFSGAIYTSLYDGGSVNANIYDAKEDVYLNGGPNTVNSKGLPDGNYYFQVTDPSGGTLLSSDDIECREVEVEGGYLHGHVENGNCDGGYHLDGSTDAVTGGIPVQLMPYDDTPNNGGEYKVWMTPVDEYYADCASGCTFGFVHSSTKTDNFKVGNDEPFFECFQIFGSKVEDMDGNGVADDGEPGVEGWLIQLILDGDVVQETYAGEDGSYTFDICEEGDYTVSEGSADGWVSSDGVTSHDFTAESGVDKGPFDFLNLQPFMVSGCKFEDMNGDGSSEGDTTIAGWTIYLDGTDGQGNEVSTSTATGEDGCYAFEDLWPGSYTVFEDVPDGWMATSADSFDFDAPSGDAPSFDFMNFELGSICGMKYLDQDHSGDFNAPEVGIEGITIELWLDGELVAQTTTDDNGMYCFEDLGPGDYVVGEVLPDGGDNPYMVWAQTEPGGDGTYEITVTSGLDSEDNDFGNVCEFTGGLTWGYWKTHTGQQKNGPAKDNTYDLLASYPMQLDIKTKDGDYLLESAAEAYDILKVAASSCSGDCRSLFRAQLIALYMNVLKFDGMGDSVYNGPGDYSGWTVQDILDEGIALLTDGNYHDFTSFQETLDDINNNGHYAAGEHVLVCTHA